MHNRFESNKTDDFSNHLSRDAQETPETRHGVAEQLAQQNQNMVIT